MPRDVATSMRRLRNAPDDDTSGIEVHCAFPSETFRRFQLVTNTSA